jgi:hypothetical protein
MNPLRANASPFLSLRRPGVILGGCLALGAALASPAAAEKIPYNNSYVSSSWCTAYPSYPFSPSCASIRPDRPFRAFLVIVDAGFGPDDPVSGRLTFEFDFTYDSGLLAFSPSLTTLLCDFRANGTDPYCPQFSPGQGTTPLAEVTDAFTVDQTGLTIEVDATGQPVVSLNYAAPTSLTVRERNFLALAFDLLTPLGPGTTVTYSPTALPGATLTTNGFFCSDVSAAVVNCDSAAPSRSLRLNPAPPPVPAPLAVGGLPVLLHATRRLRRRLQLAAR